MIPQFHAVCFSVKLITTKCVDVKKRKKEVDENDGYVVVRRLEYYNIKVLSKVLEFFFIKVLKMHFMLYLTMTLEEFRYLIFNSNN